MTNCYTIFQIFCLQPLLTPKILKKNDVYVRAVYLKRHNTSSSKVSHISRETPCIIILYSKPMDTVLSAQSRWFQIIVMYTTCDMVIPNCFIKK